MTDEANPLRRRQSLLARMKNAADSTRGADPSRKVQLTVAMDRFLARLLATSDWGSWVLKGGYANQLRAPAEARYTQDIDLKLDVPLDRAQAMLKRAASFRLADSSGSWDLFSFEIGDPKPLTGPPGGGLRFRMQALVAGQPFVSFGVDVNSKDVVVGALERHPSDPLIASLGLPPSVFPVYPIAQQFAEKLHAFTRPRDQENTRVKDLADMVWFVERYSFASDALIAAGEATFGRRGEHPWPPRIPLVPSSWTRPYGILRDEMGIAPETPMAARDWLSEFLTPVLAGQKGLRSAKGGGWVRGSR